jgi:hypothetical protein
MAKTRHEEMLAFYHHYKRITKKGEVSMAELAAAAAVEKWPIPAPISGIDRLAKQFAEALREETRVDRETKRPYRANLAITQRLPNGKQLAFWIDTDEADREKMEAAAVKYREQMIGEAVIGTNTFDHWNRTHPEQLPIPFDTDFRDEVQWRLNAPTDDEGEQAS